MTHQRRPFLFLAVALCATLLLFRQALIYMVGRWGGADYTHCALMPVVIAYLVWERRKAFAAQPAAVSAWGLGPLAVGLGLYWLGELAGEYFTLYTGFFFTLVGLVWIHLGGARLRALAFPVALIPTMFPLPSFLNNKLTFQLQLVSSALGVRMLQGIGVPALREGNVIDLGFTQLQVVEACSGLRYVLPLLILGILLASFLRGPFWKRTVLALTTLPLAVVLNALRIAATGVLYPWLGARAAEGFFHDFSGWLVFMSALGILLAEMALLNRIGKRPAAEKAGSKGASSTSPTAGDAAWAWAPPVTALVLLASSLVISHSVDFRRPIPLGRSLVSFPQRLGPWQGTRSFLDAKTLEALDLSDYAAFTYRRRAGEPAVDFYVAYYASQAKGESIHSPETCLPGSGWAVDDTARVTLRFRNSPLRILPAQRMVLRKFGETLVGYFWFDLAGRVAVNAYQIKLYNFLNALTQRRTDGALVRVLTPVGPSETQAAAERRLQDFLTRALPVLDRYLGKKTTHPGEVPRP
ncbi:exosortase D, VPLPA-CTERM-specific [Desulfacinum hydrothermale DSM 13146]|uniref:Exosortase D, VPLPA-CTERM-specific n=1 Tax=Desulfacinum hydrothermale DSM 13146 TaxID=1121390 RepID=A0A1W1XS92_9BACT|nr:VPLPA-CTERM-specific exosortase XrtD [Desulfacinum hydrothermale]SMC26724.1 exosortase D, VPLPA-CTERM-specific [Desulfacinum hydrothermale DSM 13146]